MQFWKRVISREKSNRYLTSPKHILPRFPERQRLKRIG